MNEIWEEYKRDQQKIEQAMEENEKQLKQAGEKETQWHEMAMHESHLQTLLLERVAQGLEKK